MAMKVVYIAGPFRGADSWEIEQNIRRAEREALEVWRLGAVALCPHLNTAHFQGALPDDTWLKGDLELLARCDAILMVPGWRQSTGALVEHRFAYERGLRIFQNINDLSWWLNTCDCPSCTQFSAARSSGPS